MQPSLFIILIIIAFILFQLKIILGTYLIVLVLIFYIFSIYAKSFFGLLGGIFSGLKETAGTEGQEMEKANPKVPEGKKIFEKGFSHIGESLGKGEKARIQGKKMSDDRDDFERVGEASENLLDGIFKLFRK